MSKKNAKKVVAKKEAVATIVVMETKNWNPLHVKPAALDRESNRQKMLVHVMRFDGLPREEYVANFVANPPASIKKGSKTRYTAQQWLKWFEKAGVVEITAA